MTSFDRRRWLLSATSGIALAASPFAKAATAPYPSRPLRIVVATVAGSGPDVATRQMANLLPQFLKQPVVVDNKPGANGMLAASEVARSAPDGYTLLDANIGNALNDLLRPATGSRIGQDLIPITDVTASPLILLVNANVPVKSMQELIAYARANPKALSYGSGGPGSLIQLTGERLKRAAGFEMTEVPYKSLGADIVDLLAGQIQVGFGVWGTTREFIRNGRLRALAIASVAQNAQTKDIPTFAEAGVPNLTATGWNGIFMPAGTPPEIVQTVSAAIMASIATPQFQQFFTKDGIDTGGKTPEQFDAFIKAEKASYERIIKEANIRLD